MKILTKFKNLLELGDRILELEVDKEIDKWTLEKFFKTFKYNRLSELSELMLRVFVRLLEAQKIYVSFEHILAASKPVAFVRATRTIYLDHKNLSVGAILEDLQVFGVIKLVKEEAKNAENETPVEAGA